MSGIAEIMKNLGYKVTGSDQHNNSNVLRLRRLGVKIFIGHDPSNIENASLIVYSSAISKNNPEINRIAYQNTFILKNQNSMFLKLKKVFLGQLHKKPKGQCLLKLIHLRQPNSK